MKNSPAPLIFRPYLVVTLALLLCACKPKVDVDLTLAKGAPEDAKSVVLGIDGLQFRDEDGDENEVSSSDGLTANLLDYRNAETLALVSDKDLDEKRYTGVRLRFADDNNAEVTEIDKDTFDVAIDEPADEDYADIDLDLSGNETEKLLLELDLRFSLLRNSDDSFRFKPYLRAMNPDKTGSITGRIDGGLFDDECDDNDDETPLTTGAVYLFEGSDVSPQDFFSGGSGNPVASTNVEAISNSIDFTYDFPYVAAGRYTLALTCQSENEDPFVRDGDSQVHFFKTETSINIDEEEAQILDITE